MIQNFLQTKNWHPAGFLFKFFLYFSWGTVFAMIVMGGNHNNNNIEMSCSPNNISSSYFSYDVLFIFLNFFKLLMLLFSQVIPGEVNTTDHFLYFEEVGLEQYRSSPELTLNLSFFTGLNKTQRSLLL